MARSVRSVFCRRCFACRCRFRPSAYALMSASRTTSDVFVPLCIQAIIIISFCPRLSVRQCGRLDAPFSTGVSVACRRTYVPAQKKTAHKISRRADALFACSVFRAYIEPVFSYVSNRWEWMCLLCAYSGFHRSRNTEEFSDNHRLDAGLFGLLVSVALHLPFSSDKKCAYSCGGSLPYIADTSAFRNNAKAARTALCVCTVLGVGVNVFDVLRLIFEQKCNRGL